MKFQHRVEVVSNYCTEELEQRLERMGEMGYELVSVVVARNQYHVNSMYLFFKRSVER